VFEVEPRLSREDLPGLPAVSEPSCSVVSVEVVSELEFSSVVVAVELALLLLLSLAFFFEQPAEAAATITPRTIIHSLLFIVDCSP
jgi:hypothetical protein